MTTKKKASSTKAAAAEQAPHNVIKNCSVQNGCVIHNEHTVGAVTPIARALEANAQANAENARALLALARTVCGGAVEATMGPGMYLTGF